MNWPRMLLAGAKAAGMGALIGTSLPTLATFIFGIGILAQGAGAAILVMFLPFLVGLACAATGLAVVGLPVTLWLKRRGEESRSAYLSGGLIAGAIVSIAICWWLFDGELGGVLFFSVFGALTGGATGNYWWRFARKDEVEGGAQDWGKVFE